MFLAHGHADARPHLIAGERGCKESLPEMSSCASVMATRPGSATAPTCSTPWRCTSSSSNPWIRRSVDAAVRPRPGSAPDRRRWRLVDCAQCLLEDAGPLEVAKDPAADRVQHQKFETGQHLLRDGRSARPIRSRNGARIFISSSLVVHPAASVIEDRLDDLGQLS